MKNHSATAHIPAYNAGPVVETTGAGDAFNGGFAVLSLRAATCSMRRDSGVRSPEYRSPATEPRPPCLTAKR